MKKSIYSMCGMCTVRCPIRVEVEDGRATWIEGNPHILKGALCAKGAAGLSFQYEEVRPKGPMIRRGRRGDGQWREVSWDVALDYVGERLKEIIDKYGGRSVLLSCRGGPFTDLPKAFMKAIGSPNFTNHDSACGRNVHHASQSVYGLGRKGFVYDIKNSHHLILYGRNLLESLRVKEAAEVMDAIDKGMKLTYIDVRQTVTGSKASRFWLIRPGTDYALNLGIIHTLIEKRLYDEDFINKWTQDFDKLVEFVQPYTAEWAEKETGISAKEIIQFAYEISEDKPKVIFHPGWMLARYRDSFYADRSIHILNVLMGNIEVPGGQIISKGPGDVGAKGLKSLVSKAPKVEEKRADGVGWRYKHFDKGPGIYHLFFKAMLTGEPYPLKALITYRHDPLTCFPDPDTQKIAYDKLDLIVALDAKFSEIAWYADVILPLAGYLEKDSIICTQKGPVPGFAVRRKAVEPRFDSKPEWWIFKKLANRLGAGEYFPYESIEDLWEYQLSDTGLTIKDFEEKGVVKLSTKPVLFDHEMGLDFKTPSGKIEFISQKLEDADLPSLPAYESPKKLPEGHYRLIVGRCAVHAHGHTMNNPHLNEIISENVLWINKDEAEKLEIKDGDVVELSADGKSGRIKAKITEFIHPEAIFMLHGFGRTVPVLERAFGKGMADQKVMKGNLEIWDHAGGALALLENCVKVTKV